MIFRSLLKVYRRHMWDYWGLLLRRNIWEAGLYLLPIYSLCCPGETIEIWSRIVVDGSDLQCIAVTVCWHGERFNHLSEVLCVCVLTGGWRGPPCSSSLCLESTTLCLPSPRRISASGSDWCLSWVWAPSRYWASAFIVATLVLYFLKHITLETISLFQSLVSWRHRCDPIDIRHQYYKEKRKRKHILVSKSIQFCLKCRTDICDFDVFVWNH